MCTTRGRIDDLEKLLNGNYEMVDLSNEFATLAFSVSTQQKNESLITTTKKMHSETKLAKSSVDSMVLKHNQSHKLLLTSCISYNILAIIRKYELTMGIFTVQDVQGAFKWHAEESVSCLNEYDRDGKFNNSQC